jgi:radical SAM superfamily enzyme YgiQ (UPF0313 family)
MVGTDVILIGYEDQENLGLRSIKSFLHTKNIKASILPFRPGHEKEILESIIRAKPLIIGFSIIFQYTISDFAELTRHLRSKGILCHFTAGGHYPSLEPHSTFEELPELDSIVRFEGEITLTELFLQLSKPESWSEIGGLAYKSGSSVVINSTRPSVDLDILPDISRDFRPNELNGLNSAFMLASRGCLYNCSFCSIRQFYKNAGGSLRRSRSAKRVVDEMVYLYKEHNINFFSFQDDDFAYHSSSQKNWVNDFITQLKIQGLAKKIKWKISCRVDDLTSESIEMMRECGLIAVYLGVESGNKTGLITLNKGVTVEQNLAAIELIKKYNLALSIGFMMFDPSSSIESIRQNIEFLKSIGEDGYFPINFCKMLPYAGTPIKEELENSNRLLGTKTRPDYEFLDPLVNWYYFIVNRIFSRRNFHSDGLVTILQNLDFENRLEESLMRSGPTSITRELKNIIKAVNNSATETLTVLLNILLEKGVDYLLDEKKTLLQIINNEWQTELDEEKKLQDIEILRF